jgi:hypothetical protein
MRTKAQEVLDRIGYIERIDEADLTMKHFKIIADVINRSKVLNSVVKSQFVDEMSGALGQINPKFKESLFKKACGVG